VGQPARYLLYHNVETAHFWHSEHIWPPGLRLAARVLRVDPKLAELVTAPNEHLARLLRKVLGRLMDLKRVYKLKLRRIGGKILSLARVSILLEINQVTVFRVKPGG
jgi:hypothetical protein